MASIFEVETSLFKKRIIHFPHLMSLQHKKVAQLPLVVTLENLVWYIKFGSILLVSISSIPPCCATLWCCIKLVGHLGPCAPENKWNILFNFFDRNFFKRKSSFANSYFVSNRNKLIYLEGNYYKTVYKIHYFLKSSSTRYLCSNDAH